MVYTKLSHLVTWGYQFSRATVTQCHTLGGLESWKFILSRFWRPQVHDEGAVPGRGSSLASSSFWWLQALFSFDSLAPVSASVLTGIFLFSVSSFSDTCHWIYHPPPPSHTHASNAERSSHPEILNLITSAKTLFPKKKKKGHTYSFRGLRLRCILWGLLLNLQQAVDTLSVSWVLSGICWKGVGWGKSTSMGWTVVGFRSGPAFS